MNDELFSKCHILFDCVFELYGLITFLVVVKIYTFSFLVPSAHAQKIGASEGYY